MKTVWWSGHLLPVFRFAQIKFQEQIMHICPQKFIWANIFRNLEILVSENNGSYFDIYAL
jgi:hypothetical protein